MRRCSKCKKEKLEDEFHKDKSQVQGISYECKSCKSERRKISRKENPEHYRNQQKNNLEKNYTSIRESQKRFYTQNRESILSKRRELYRINRENILKKENERRKTPEFRAYARGYQQKLRKERKELIYSWSLVAKAIKKGKMIKGDKCELCGSVCKIEGHHADYSKPLEVQWICKKCHVNLHKNY
ncbi:MAG: hypothetical protein JSR39_11435 [Verrucomicrobia bacterium]|nr:hypothetical protein [Verrucomicrobiota bacterium]